MHPWSGSIAFTHLSENGEQVRALHTAASRNENPLAIFKPALLENCISMFWLQQQTATFSTSSLFLLSRTHMAILLLILVKDTLRLSHGIDNQLCVVSMPVS